MGGDFQLQYVLNQGFSSKRKVGKGERKGREGVRTMVNGKKMEGGRKGGRSG